MSTPTFFGVPMKSEDGIFVYQDHFVRIEVFEAYLRCFFGVPTKQDPNVSTWKSGRTAEGSARRAESEFWKWVGVNSRP